MCNPRVYVGTYKKYNSGSLKGGWLDLRECKDYKQFLSKCRALHRGERDPEFMIQDVEDFPDGLACGEWLSEQDFNDVIEACKEENEPTDSAVSLAEQLRAALLMQLGKAKRIDDSKALLEDYIAEMEKAWPNDGHMLDYFRKQWSGGVRLANGGIVCFEKPSISNSFWFHDEGPNYEYYKELMADRETRLRQYFLHANLDEMDERIRALECDCHFPEGEYHSCYYCKTWYLQRASYTSQREPLNVWRFYAWSEYDVENEPWRYEPGSYVKMSDDDRQTILEGMRREREKFDKRLQTYLKRYGLSKIRTGTYWADR